ncbi:DUF6252 family protein [uncultured Flavobacterium sp.]|uniref:DUF6252 family protein n=1 Tax=uncultured Flavobacterium sp. TaxID=165435 RepID=UPI0030EB48A1|tara:strand:+ start:203744 stop:204196 length:453 start_codon:yes stop_codon:yes gene_type:complete
MKKIILVLTILVTFASCTDDVAFNDPSFQGIKNGENWRANDARVILNPDGSMTVEAYSQFEIVTFEVSSANVGVRTFGVNTANVATYDITIDGVTDSYETGVNVGSGELKITESPTVTGKLSGTFKFRAVNANGIEAGYTNGVIYSVPVK